MKNRVLVGCELMPLPNAPTARLYERLGAMPVRIQYARDPKPQSWRTDWPAVPASRWQRRSGSDRRMTP